MPPGHDARGATRALFGELATLRADVSIGIDVDALRWTRSRDEFVAWSEQLGTPLLHERVRYPGVVVVGEIVDWKSILPRQ